MGELGDDGGGHGGAEHLEGLGEAGQLLGPGDLFGQQGVDRDGRRHPDPAEHLGDRECAQGAPLHGLDGYAARLAQHRGVTCRRPPGAHHEPELEPPTPPPEKPPPELPKPDPPEEPGVAVKVPLAAVANESTAEVMLSKSGKVRPW